MSKEYYYLVRWTETEGWELAPDVEANVLPDGTIWDAEGGGWQLPYLGDGKFNGKEEELADELISLLNLNKREKEGK